jgi:LacI family transcriptional regulator
VSVCMGEQLALANDQPGRMGEQLALANDQPPPREEAVMMISKKNINSSTIAKLAGVSRSTVSRVINNYSDISEETREKVLEAIRQNNYYPNIAAQSLAGKRKKTIGLFVITDEQLAENYITNSIMVNVFGTASENAYHVFTGVIRDIAGKDPFRSVREAFLQKRVDAAIFTGMVNKEPFIEELVADGYIIGVLDQETPRSAEQNRIVYNFNHRETAKNAILYLTKLGHKKISIINGNSASCSGIEKKLGFEDGLSQAEISIRQEWYRNSNCTGNNGYTITKEFLADEKDRPTAICCASDSIAFGAIKAIKEEGLEIPGDISVIGMDDHVFSALADPPLTTFRQDYREIVKALTLKVISMVEREKCSEFTKVKFNSELVERESCRKMQ